MIWVWVNCTELEHIKVVIFALAPFIPGDYSYGVVTDQKTSFQVQSEMTM